MAIPEPLRHLGVERVVPFHCRLRVPFRGLRHREGLLFEGPAGWGEWAPFVEYGDVVGTRWLQAALESACGDWPAEVRDSVECAGIIPALEPEEAATEALDAVRESGVTALKVKVGGAAIDQDIARLDAVFDAVPGTTQFRLDANGSWTVGDAVTVALRYPAARIEYLEQPCATLAECADVRRRTGLRVAVDEGLRIDDPTGARTDELAGAVDLVVLKVAPLGGVAAAMRLAERIGLPVVVSGAMDTAVGLGAGVALAAALPSQQFAAGLGTGRLLATDVVTAPLIPAGARLRVHRVEPDREVIARSSLLADRIAWWEQRLDRCSRLMASEQG